LYALLEEEWLLAMKEQLEVLVPMGLVLVQGGTGAGSRGGCSEEGLGYNSGAVRDLAALFADSVLWWLGRNDGIVGSGDSPGRKQWP
jgi:hypothetical protein